MKYFLYLFIPLFLLASCSKDDEGNGTNNARVAVQFGSQIAGNGLKTTNGGDHWTTQDPIGIFMIAKNAATISGNIKENADNIEYRATPNSSDAKEATFAPANTSETIYYPVNGNYVDFIAYYPYKATGTAANEIDNYKYPVDVSSQTNPAAIDVLYSNNAKGADKGSSTLNLQFKHVLSKLSFTLNAGTGAPNLTNATVEVSKLVTKASLDLNNGNLTNDATSAVTVDVSSGSVIAIPQDISNQKLTVTVGSDVYTSDFPANTTLEGGKNYEYTITVNKTGISVSIGNITDWDYTTVPQTTGIAAYKVGDYYPDPNVVYKNDNSGTVISGTKAIGVVFWVNPADRRHGKVVRLHEKTGRLGIPGVDESIDVAGIKSSTDGKTATQNLINKRKGNYFFATDYLIFYWIYNDVNQRNVNGEWYLPAKYELEYLLCGASGNPFKTWDSGFAPFSFSSVNMTVFNAKLTAAGGDILYSGVTSWYWSSTENSDTTVSALYFGNSQVNNNSNKASTHKARCILAF